MRMRLGEMRTHRSETRMHFGAMSTYSSAVRVHCADMRACGVDVSVYRRERRRSWSLLMGGCAVAALREPRSSFSHPLVTTEQSAVRSCRTVPRSSDGLAIAVA
jgi:hypothetical protein